MRKRNNPIQVMLNERELNALAVLREKSALSTSAIIRKLILDERIKERPNADFIKLTAEINNIGINFNQLVYKAHTVGYLTDEDLRATRAAFEMILKKLHEWEKIWR